MHAYLNHCIFKAKYCIFKNASMLKNVTSVTHASVIGTSSYNLYITCFVLDRYVTCLWNSIVNRYQNKTKHWRRNIIIQLYTYTSVLLRLLPRWYVICCFLLWVISLAPAKRYSIIFSGRYSDYRVHLQFCTQRHRDVCK